MLFCLKNEAWPIPIKKDTHLLFVPIKICCLLNHFQNWPLLFMSHFDLFFVLSYLLCFACLVPTSFEVFQSIDGIFGWLMNEAITQWKMCSDKWLWHTSECLFCDCKTLFSSQEPSWEDFKILGKSLKPPGNSRI